MISVAIRHALPGFKLDVAFDTGPGVTALFGPSGAGKTSIANAVAGLLRTDTGRVAIDGEVLLDTGRGIDLPPHQRRLGYVFQDARLFPQMTVRQNLRYGARFARPGGTALPEDDVIALLGIGDLLARRPRALSGGERQRVALGRALLSRPRALIMDEPLASLDAPRKAEILPYLERLRAEAGLPILYVSHALDEIARLADHLILLHAGQVAVAGPVFDVLADPAAMRLLGVREAGAVLLARVEAHGPDGLTRLRTAGGALELPGVAAPEGALVRVRVLAHDVMLSLRRPEGLSAQNILPVTITEVHHGGGPGAAVLLDAGGDRLLARITARSARDMGLRPGLSCYAILKATTVAPEAIGR